MRTKCQEVVAEDVATVASDQGAVLEDIRHMCCSWGECPNWREQIFFLDEGTGAQLGK